MSRWARITWWQRCGVCLVCVLLWGTVSIAEKRPSVGSTPGSLSYAFIDLSSGKMLATKGAEKSVKPASIMKLVTSLAAFERLGPSFRFTTSFVGRKAGSVVERLVLVGGGSPGFTIEDLWLMVRGLKAQGIESVKQVVIDDTLFVDPKPRSGIRAYEAGTSAVSFNFNSLTVHLCPRRVGSAAAVTIDPFELRLPLSGAVRTTTKRGSHYRVDESGKTDDGLAGLRVGGGIRPGSRCEPVYRSVQDPRAYLGRTVVGLLTAVGISAPRSWTAGQKRRSEGVLYEHRSETLGEVIRQMNHFSNNFMADQLLYAVGGVKTSKWSFKTGLKYVSSLIQRKFPKASFRNYDGSGLSHQNRVTARLMANVVRDAVTDVRYGPEFVASLPVAGRSGTLKDRVFRVPSGAVRAKTGTLNGVSSLAGIITTKRGQRIGFALITNGGKGRGTAHMTERMVLERVYGW